MGATATKKAIGSVVSNLIGMRFGSNVSRGNTHHSRISPLDFLIGAGFWYQTNPVTDLHDTRTRNWCRKNGVDFRRLFLEHVSWV